MATAPPRLSVAMTTYQGARYLEEQLTTLLGQSTPPDEIVISDDASTDGTWGLLREFARTSPTPVRLLRQTHNVGLRANIEQALFECRGAVVVLADQDDLWMPDKLAAIAHAFRDPDVMLWFSDAALIDQDGADLGATAWQATHFDADEQRRMLAGSGLERLLHGMTVTGATMAVRSEVVSMALPLPVEVGGPGGLFLHDAWLALLASLRGRVVIDRTQFTAYRQHREQITGRSMAQVTHDQHSLPSPPLRPEAEALRRRRQLALDHARTKLVAERLREKEATPSCREDAVHELLLRESFLDVRVLPRGEPRRRVQVLRELLLGHYSRFARGVLTAAKDLA